MGHTIQKQKPITQQEINRRLGLLIDLAMQAAERADRQREAQQAGEEKQQKPNAASTG